MPQAAQTCFAALRPSGTSMFLHVCAFFFAALPPLLWLGSSWPHCAAFVPAVHVGLGATVSPSVRPFEGPAHYLRLPLGSFGSAPACRTSHRRLAGRSANRAQRSACAHLAVRPHTQCELDALGGMKLALLSLFIPLSCSLIICGTLLTVSAQLYLPRKVESCSRQASSVGSSFDHTF